MLDAFPTPQEFPTRVVDPPADLLRKAADAAGVTETEAPVTTVSTVCRVGDRSHDGWEEPSIDDDPTILHDEDPTLLRPAEEPTLLRAVLAPPPPPPPPTPTAPLFVSENAISHLTAKFADATFVPIPATAPAPSVATRPSPAAAGVPTVKSSPTKRSWSKKEVVVDLLLFFLDGVVFGAGYWALFGHPF